MSRSSRFQILARGRTKKARGEMNRNESRYAETLTAAPDVVDWWYEPLRLRISHPPEGRGAWYTADFLILMADGTVMIDDVKSGGGFDDNAAAVRAKACAEQYPLFVFRIVTPVPKKHGGGWKIQIV